MQSGIFYASEPVPAYGDVALGTAPWCLEAAEHYFGKTADETFEMLMRFGACMEYINSLNWVGPVAFRYYIKPVIRYCLSLGHICDPGIGETCDPDSINAVAGTLAIWLKHQPAELVVCALELENFCQEIYSDFERFDANPEIYMGLREEYISLAGSLSQLRR